ncbi:RYamide receptor-like [Hyalella azteca]|uniref:RYamide receptor-like n=1 Tax=Hyalella azteca TaxID=294128 RepID=A0A8B7P557_HYAAZ|nr:RYamide receptor-like [Hyalella azteca]
MDNVEVNEPWNFTNESIYEDLPNMDAVSGSLQTFIIIMYSLTALLSFVGNVSVIVVLACGRRSSVRVYLINLAVSDITMAVFCIPFTYTRYNALVHPLNARWTKSRVLPTLCGLWALSLGGSSVQLFVTSAQKTQWGEHHFYQCEERWPVTPHELYKKLYTVAVLIFTFVFPLTCLAHSYVSIVSMMCRHKLPGNADASRDRQRNLSKAKAINMMLAVVICFTICWMPMHILMLLITFCKEVSRCYSNSECFPYYMSVFVCHWIAMSNSFMNPFIYCFMSNNFREDLLQFTRRCRGRRRSQASLRGSDPGSSGRTALYVTHRTSIRGKGKTLTRHGCCTPETQHHYGCIHAHEMTARQQSGPPLVLIQIVNSNINFMINSSNDNYMINSSINRCKDNCMTNSSKDNCMINRSNNSNIC